LANDRDTMAMESLKTINEADNKTDVIDNKAQCTRDTLEGVSERERNVDNVLSPVKEIGEAGGVDGAQIIRNQLPTLTLSVSCIQVLRKYVNR
jgi:hypothetical protein